MNEKIVFDAKYLHSAFKVGIPRNVGNNDDLLGGNYLAYTVRVEFQTPQAFSLGGIAITVTGIDLWGGTIVGLVLIGNGYLSKLQYSKLDWEPHEGHKQHTDWLNLGTEIQYLPKSDPYLGRHLGPAKVGTKYRHLCEDDLMEIELFFHGGTSKRLRDFFKCKYGDTSSMVRCDYRPMSIAIGRERLELVKTFILDNYVPYLDAIHKTTCGKMTSKNLECQKLKNSCFYH